MRRFIAPLLLFLAMAGAVSAQPEPVINFQMGSFHTAEFSPGMVTLCHKKTGCTVFVESPPVPVETMIKPGLSLAEILGMFGIDVIPEPESEFRTLVGHVIRPTDFGLLYDLMYSVPDYPGNEYHYVFYPESAKLCLEITKPFNFEVEFACTEVQPGIDI